MQHSEFVIELLPCLQDNYGFILINKGDRSCYIIDTPDGEKIRDWIKDHKLHLRGILNTHHHHDHIGGNIILKEEFNCPVYGAEQDKERISGITDMLKEGDHLALFEGLLKTEIIALDGHTIGLIAYYFPKLDALFVGDALFNLGCGYMFEGTQEQMWASMLKIKSLPENTDIYAAHEYSLKNAEFVDHIMPANKERALYINSLKEKRAAGLFTIPTSLRDQKKFNPFLQANMDIVKNVTKTHGQSDAITFGALRALKNNFL